MPILNYCVFKKMIKADKAKSHVKHLVSLLFYDQRSNSKFTVHNDVDVTKFS